MQNQVNWSVKRNKTFFKRGVSVLKWGGITLSLFILIGFACQQILTKLTADDFPPIGERVDIGDYKLHVYAQGEANDHPTIILESGLGTPSSYTDWKHIQSELSRFTRVISYDRAGYGWSDVATNERTAEHIADDLYSLLNQSGEKGPYILVGHSFGGFTSQVFARKHVEEVVGLVLIDSSHVDQKGGYSAVESYGIRVLKEIGTGRVLEWLNMLPMYDYFINDDLSIHFFHQHFYNRSQISELKWMMSKSIDQVRTAQAQGFGEIPITVLSAEHEEIPEWSDLQQQTSTLSVNGKHIVVNGASHYIHLDQPEVVLSSILEILDYHH
ncbi:alpha/beta fold hydrolase [Halalkalibacter akibai]|uniref:AB hydrolase-1 domain-containing protein n=1 Tax=Halalkalibacter akibai (strain ATCC 43226 / DSM 21942 / CIP 109018 / JCM 9157 / 1139) TaxID=1236973 RepID=W4QWV0_HALA3|nr:alpha/beta hydrolase [Halalkalibacter akibai]GAE36600.1 hypothetical protein JCM9157_3799 [Halalkalibacter akibai JCM 9157]